MLGQRRRRWANIKRTMVKRRVFAGIYEVRIMLVNISLPS